MWERRPERARQETGRIFRQYDAAGPENRMVARSAGARHGAAPARRHRPDGEHGRFRASMPARLSGADRERIRGAVADIARLWNAGDPDDGVRASVLSLMVERTVATREGASERIAADVHWHGGRVTAHRLRAPVRRPGRLTSFGDPGRRAPGPGSGGRTQREIAGRLNAEGYRPPGRARFSVGSVPNLPGRLRPPAEGPPRPRRPPADRGPHEWTVGGFADLPGMPGPTVCGWVTAGVVPARRPEGSARWLILADDAGVARLGERRRAAAAAAEGRAKEGDTVAGKRQ